MTAGVRVHVLGELQARRDGQPVRISRGAAAVVLSVLASTDAPVPAERLDGALRRADDRDRSRRTVHTAVWRLRRALGPDAVSSDDGYSLVRPPCRTDVEDFEVLVNRGDEARLSGQLASAVTSYTSALSLWRGPALDLLAGDPVGAAARRRLHELRAATVEARSVCLIATGHPDEAIGDLERLVHEEPLRERGWALLASALEGAGRSVEAAACVTRARRLLAVEGLQPGKVLQAEADRLGVDHGFPGQGRPTEAHPERLARAAALAIPVAYAAGLAVVVVPGVDPGTIWLALRSSAQADASTIDLRMATASEIAATLLMPRPPRWEPGAGRQVVVVDQASVLPGTWWDALAGLDEQARRAPLSIVVCAPPGAAIPTEPPVPMAIVGDVELAPSRREGL